MSAGKKQFPRQAFDRIKRFSGAWIVVITLTMLSLFAGCKRSESSPEGTSPQNVSSSQPVEQGYFKTSFQTESQFVIESIVTDIAEMLYFARNHTVPKEKAIVANSREIGGDSDAPVYEVTVQLGDSPAVQTKLKISGPIWSETVYADITSELAKSLKMESPATTPGNDVSILESLADGLADTIAQEDMQLSANLEKDFTNPALHEQAAALLGAFTLRESPSVFYDIRLPLSRMTAHLAVARFLSGDHPLGIVGRVADCMLAKQMNNELDAVQKIENLDKRQEPVAMWARVLKARETLDFRPLDAAKTVPGIGNSLGSPRILEPTIVWLPGTQ